MITFMVNLNRFHTLGAINMDIEIQKITGRPSEQRLKMTDSESLAANTV